VRTTTRTLAAASLGLVVLLPAVGSAAEGAPAGAKTQTVTGSIATANPTKASGTNVTRVGRTGGLVGPQTNGVTGWFFSVDPKTWGGEFVLTSATAGSDLDVIFYSDPGSLTGAPAATGEFVGAQGDGERGVVPASTTHALIYAAGAPTTGFEYAGHAVPKVLVGNGSLDLVVPVGGAVEFVNATADYTFVTSLGTTSATRFPSSGTGPGSGIPVGKSHLVTFTRAGAFAYETSVGTGTITVR
jgi:hypothetical protein